MEIIRGTVFNTLAEDNCIALESPDECGNFMAMDSENVECQFSVQMVIEHEAFVIPKGYLEHPEWIGGKKARELFC